MVPSGRPHFLGLISSVSETVCSQRWNGAPNKMTQALRAHAALPEIQSWVPNTQVGNTQVSNSNSRVLNTLLTSASTTLMCTCPYTDTLYAHWTRVHTPIYIHTICTQLKASLFLMLRWKKQDHSWACSVWNHTTVVRILWACSVPCYNESCWL